MLSSAFCKILVLTILQGRILYYSRIKPPRKGKNRIHHMLIQIYCRPLFRSGLTKGTCNQRTSCVCSIVSLYIYLHLTKITRDFAQKWIFYRQSLIGYNFANCIDLRLAIDPLPHLENFVHYVFLKLQYISHKMRYVSPLRVEPLSCNNNITYVTL